MKYLITLSLSCVIVMAMAACGGPKLVLTTSSELAAAETTEKLVQLYQKTEIQKEAASRSQKETLKAIQLTIADKLSGKIEQQINTSLDNNRQKNGLVDIETLQYSHKMLAPLKAIDPTNYQRLKSLLLAFETRAKNKIRQFESDLDKQPRLSIKGLSLLKSVSTLSGVNSQATKDYLTTRAHFLQSLSQQARVAFGKRMFNTSLELAQKGLQIDLGNLQLESMLTQSKMALFEARFRSAMEKGKPDQAYQSLIAVTDNKIIQLIKRRMNSSINLLAKYFANNAQLLYLKDRLYDAYLEFEKGRKVQELLDRGKLGFPQERLFLDKIMLKVESSSPNLGRKYGLLLLVAQFDPEYPTLEDQLRKVKEQIAMRATTKIMVADFKEVASSNSVIASVGRRVASQLENALFNQLGQQIQIVSEHQNSEMVTPFDGPAFLIKGIVLQSAIETSRHSGKRSKIVQVGVEKIETEAYKKWEKRKRGEQPNQYITKEVMQEVFLSVQHIKKLAALEVSYQVIVPTSHKIIVTKVIEKEDQFLGEAIAEFTQGLFRQNFVEPKLPSDIDIMNQLAKQVSQELGASLIDFLAEPASHYYASYQKAIEGNRYQYAIEMLSNALVVASDDRETNEWAVQLKQAAVQF